MKIKSTIAFFVFLFTAFLFMNSSEGPASIQGEDRTGSPLSSASCDNENCHTSGTFDPTVSVEVTSGGVPISGYEPGGTYTIKITVEAGTGTPSAYGFQVVSLNSDNEQGGEWGFFPNGGQQAVTFANGITYQEHAGPISENVITPVIWDAPAVGGGDVTFYVGAIASNDDGGVSGDGTAIASVTISEGFMTSTTDEIEQSLGCSVFPNPTQESLNLKINSLKSGPVNLKITDIAGKTLHHEEFNISEGDQTKQLDLSQFDNGLYLLFLSNETDVITETIVKI